MKALIVVAHGSRNQASNQEVFSRVLEVADKLESQFDLVQTAFLELTTPDIAECVRDCAEAGANEVFIMPYFLAAGRHVEFDMPEQIATLVKRYAQVDITLLNYLGAAEHMSEFLSQHIQTQVNAFKMD